MKLPRTTIETITPELASEYLKANTTNRVLRTTHVRDLAGAMKRGEWELTHQGIAFDVTGALRDGQHRLHAVILSGVAVNMMVTHDLPEKAKMVMDRGVIRTNADLTGLARRAVEVLSIFASLRRDGDLSAKISPQEILNEVPLFGGTIEMLEQIAPSSRKGITAAPVRAAAVLWARGGNEAALEQYRAITVLDFDAMEPVVKALVRQLMNDRGSFRGATLREAVFVRAMTAFDPVNATASKIQVSNTTARLRKASNFLESIQA